MLADPYILPPTCSRSLLALLFSKDCRDQGEDHEEQVTGEIMSGIKYKPRGSKRRADKVKAGKAAAAKLSPEGRQELATSGGQALLRKYGQGYFRSIRLHGLRKKKKKVR